MGHRVKVGWDIGLELGGTTIAVTDNESVFTAGGVNLLFASISAGANRSCYGASYTSINVLTAGVGRV